MSGANIEDAIRGERPLSADLIAAILKRVHSDASIDGPLLLCLLTGNGPLPLCEAMPRDPTPPTGMVFGDDFADRLAAALAINPSVHDGAVILRRMDPSMPYLIAGWSYRLMAPLPADHVAVANRGSAYNSCVATSAQNGVDLVCLLSHGQLMTFIAGTER